MSLTGTRRWHRSLGVVRRSMRTGETAAGAHPLAPRDYANAAVVRRSLPGSPEVVHAGCCIVQEVAGELLVAALDSERVVATYPAGTWLDAASYGRDGYMLVAFAAVGA